MMTFWQQMARIGILAGLAVFLWAVMNLPFTKTEIKKWITKVRIEILPEQKRRRKEIYDKIIERFYPEYHQMKEKGEIP